MALVIYEWEAWHGFLLSRAFPEALRLPAHPNEEAKDVLARLPSDASAFAFHLNVTFARSFPRDRPELVRALVERGIVPLNAGVMDISKRAIQTTCAELGLPVAAAAREGDPDERVMVKSNHNYGGHGDRLLPAERAAAAGPLPSAVVATHEEYRVLPRRDVPAAWWDDAGLAIERYIENPANRIYRITFVADTVVVYRMTNPHLVKKVSGSTSREIIYTTLDALGHGHPSVGASVSDAMIRFIAASGFDFGALDIIEDAADHAHIIDANTTTYGNFTFGLRSMIRFRRALAACVLARGHRASPYWRRVRTQPLPTFRLVTGEARRLQRAWALARNDTR